MNKEREHFLEQVKKEALEGFDEGGLENAPKIICPHCQTNSNLITWRKGEYPWLWGGKGLNWILEMYICGNCEEKFYIESKIEKIRVLADKPYWLHFFSSL